MVSWDAWSSEKTLSIARKTKYVTFFCVFSCLVTTCRLVYRDGASWYSRQQCTEFAGGPAENRACSTWQQDPSRMRACMHAYATRSASYIFFRYRGRQQARRVLTMSVRWQIAPCRQFHPCVALSQPYCDITWKHADYQHVLHICSNIAGVDAQHLQAVRPPFLLYASWLCIECAQNLGIYVQNKARWGFCQALLCRMPSWCCCSSLTNCRRPITPSRRLVQSVKRPAPGLSWDFSGHIWGHMEFQTSIWKSSSDKQTLAVFNKSWTSYRKLEPDFSLFMFDVYIRRCLLLHLKLAWRWRTFLQSKHKIQHRRKVVQPCQWIPNMNPMQKELVHDIVDSWHVAVLLWYILVKINSKQRSNASDMMRESIKNQQQFVQELQHHTSGPADNSCTDTFINTKSTAIFGWADLHSQQLANPKCLQCQERNSPFDTFRCAASSKPERPSTCSMCMVMVIEERPFRACCQTTGRLDRCTAGVVHECWRNWTGSWGILCLWYRLVQSRSLRINMITRNVREKNCLYFWIVCEIFIIRIEPSIICASAPTREREYK